MRPALRITKSRSNKSVPDQKIKIEIMIATNINIFYFGFDFIRKFTLCQIITRYQSAINIVLKWDSNLEHFGFEFDWVIPIYLYWIVSRFWLPHFKIVTCGGLVLILFPLDTTYFTVLEQQHNNNNYFHFYFTKISCKTLDNKKCVNPYLLYT